MGKGSLAYRNSDWLTRVQEPIWPELGRFEEIFKPEIKEGEEEMKKESRVETTSVLTYDGPSIGIVDRVTEKQVRDDLKLEKTSITYNIGKKAILEHGLKTEIMTVSDRSFVAWFSISMENRKLYFQFHCDPTMDLMRDMADVIPIVMKFWFEIYGLEQRQF